MVTEVIEGLKGMSFEELFLWAATDIKPDALLEETVTRLHVFSIAESQARPSPLEIRARPSSFYDRRRDAAKIAFLTSNQQYQSFLNDLESLAEERSFRKEDRKKIVSEIGVTYTALLLNGKSVMGGGVAASSLFRSYLTEMVRNDVKPGWHYYTLLKVLGTSHNTEVISSLMESLNLYALIAFDCASAWFDERYESAIGPSPSEIHWLELYAKGIDDKIKEHFEYQINQIEDRVKGYGLGRQRFQEVSRHLVNTLLDETDNSVWRQFLLYKDSFGMIARHAGMFTPGPYEFDPEADINWIREFVDESYVHNPKRTFEFINRYLKVRFNFHMDSPEKLDQLVKDGKWTIPRIATIFSEQRERSNPEPKTTYGGEGSLWKFWYNEIMSGNLSPSEARLIPQQFFSVRGRLMAELKKRNPRANEGTFNEQYDNVHYAQTVNKQYAHVLTSKNMLKEPDLLIATVGIGLEPTDEQINSLLDKGYSREELLQRLQTINEWTTQTDTTITPKLLDYLSGQQDLQTAFTELDELRERTQSGKFNLDNVLQCELEFDSYVKLEAKTFGPQRQNTSPNMTQMYEQFKGLEMLPPLQEEGITLTGQELIEIDRTAYEATGLVQFLTKFQEQTNRQIYVIGNNRYGEFFVVQPVEEFLDRNIRIRYDRVSSGGTGEDTVPDVFSSGFVRELAQGMPHIVIVDGANPPKDDNTSRFSRATLGYANWFALFNDIRAGGDISVYQSDSPFPEEHLIKLRESSQYDPLRIQLEELVGSGQTYNVVQWMPELNDYVYYGDSGVVRKLVNLSTDHPLVVMANPIIYDSNEGLPRSFRHGRPGYWDDPEKNARQETIIGFGSLGVEARTEGRNLEKLLEVVQHGITEGVKNYLRFSK